MKICLSKKTHDSVGDGRISFSLDLVFSNF